MQQIQSIQSKFNNGKIDFIFASELIYLEDTIVELALTLKCLCDFNTRVIFAYRIRLEWKIEIYWKFGRNGVPLKEITKTKSSQFHSFMDQ